ncbi:MAG: methyltransferase [Deltaproteobacteria bacterium]|nr:methyltransferase [Deltaproteobacteria bacterium]
MSDELSPIKRALYELTAARRRVTELEEARREPIAVVGMGLRFPGGADDPERLWRMLDVGTSAVTELPRSRITHGAHVGPESSPLRAGYLENVASFDAGFFGISPREAVSMDPQHRLALEVSWEALEHAGRATSRLAGSATGVFFGVGNSDYGRAVMSDLEGLDVYSCSGSAYGPLAGRVSYSLGLVGPCLVVDTACSSSLVAVHLAVQSLRSGECATALAGGVNLILGRESTIALSRAGMLAPDGLCKAFDGRADGFGRGEGCGVVVLRRLRDAEADGDRILALIRGSAVNQDGRSAGLTVPSGPAQEAVIRAALANGGVAARDVGYVEAHGTGTALGDPIEAHALASVFGDRSSPLLVGSVKTNLGHLEAAAGVAGLIKTILSFEHERVPASLHFETLNPHIDFRGAPIEVAGRARAWRRGEQPRLAGVSSFGFSGTNAHVVVEEGRRSADPDTPKVEPHILCISGRTSSALEAQVNRYLTHLRGCGSRSARDLCYTSSAGRTHFAHRRAVIGATVDELVKKLSTGEGPEGESAGSPLVAVLISGPMAGPGSSSSSMPREPHGRAFVETLTRLLGSRVVVAGSGLGELEAFGIGVIVELGSAPEAARTQSVFEIPRLSASSYGWSGLLEVLAKLYVLGVDVDWQSLHDGRSRLTTLPTYPFERSSFWRDSAEREGVDGAWNAAVDAGARQAGQCPVELDLRSYSTRWEVLEHLSTAYMIRALEELRAFERIRGAFSIAELSTAAGIAPRFEVVLGKWMARLVAAGVVQRVGSASIQGTFSFVMGGGRAFDVESRLAEARTVCGPADVILDYVEASGRELSSILSGRASALEILFPGGSVGFAERLYEHAPLSRYTNAIVGQVIRAICGGAGSSSSPRAHRTLLELGAGTGATTMSVLPGLDPTATTYWFTDLSELFLSRARERLREYPFVELKILDLEKDFSGQGVPSAAFDVVVGTNVVHATRDVRAALGRAASAVAPGGFLVLCEATTPHAWYDVTTALIEGWTRFDDDGVRTDQPLVSTDTWKQLLSDTGFERVAVFPRPGSPAEVVGQHVIVAQRLGDSMGARPMLELAASPIAKHTREGWRMETHSGRGPSGVADALRSARGGERRRLMLEFVRAQLRQVLRMEDAAVIDSRQKLAELGVDSLMALELRALLGNGLGSDRPLPSTLIFDHPTVGQLSMFLERSVLGLGTEAEALSERAQAMEALSEEEAERLLLERLARLK